MKFNTLVFVILYAISLASDATERNEFVQGSPNQIQLEALKPFEWSQVLEIPPGANLQGGSQILHFKSRDKHYSENPDSKRFFDQYLVTACKLQSDASVLRYASDAVTISNGAFLEMGVCTGKTINFIAGLNPHKTIYGFDSFEGLPEEWVRQDRIFQKGTFAFKGQYLPPVLHNVLLYKGLFKDILPHFKTIVLKDKPIAFLHMDADIYSSTRDVFDALGDNLHPGTIIVFDELYNYPGFEHHEWRALQEFMAKKKFGVQFLSFNENHEQVAVKLLDGGN